MPVYLVEEMRGKRAVRASRIEASTPRAAASTLSGRRFTVRKWGREWIQVTDELSGNVFVYCFAEDEEYRKDTALG
ncbi:hypothetical protein FJ970_16420 [Mesorhizobium sp. B2-1-8]|uniref:hypothetical protein n=1 Tax=unclassified Mesorhizobium TaxID=325217 RepID=UPI00112D31B4|nr:MULTISPECIES: hypothetical protein [unclassified Mesorhizobium]MBZ9673829.1 hypothetical protein [Mesorhizobium sp. ES1-3]MBZ9711078.1 hypothetical protein [Mesorhizobium sp. ESP7-2]TPI22387.1 hypothetical protein FJW08_31185 [Mesorhizobium sp. B3-2-1]UCI16755.1 hypothetical protein FJ970_16420 [Mesorhizobium sp. B2-1-8]